MKHKIKVILRRRCCLNKEFNGKYVIESITGAVHLPAARWDLCRSRPEVGDHIPVDRVMALCRDSDYEVTVIGPDTAIGCS